MKNLLFCLRVLGVAAILLVLPLLTSCTHYFYASTVHQTALLSKAGDVSVNAGVGSADETNFSHLNAAYALDSHWGVYGSFYSAKHPGSPSGGNGRYGDLGVGYFGGLRNPKIRYELFGGFGTARVFNRFDSADHLYNNFNKFFVQGNLGYKTQYFTATLALRGGWIGQYNISSYATFDSNHFTLAQDLNNNKHQLAFEPGLYLAGGYKHIQLQLGMGLTYMAPLGKSTTTYSYQQSFITAGLRINFNTRN